MALVEEYYELNEAEDVTGIWKIIQIIFYVAAGCLGLWCGYTMAILRERFGDKCYLYTKVKLSGDGKGIDSPNLIWEPDSWCDFCQYSMVSSFIVATIWATFFLMCGNGGRALTGLPQPWRIVWPSLVFSFIYFIVALCTAISVQEGTNKFCQRNETEIRQETLMDSCKTLKSLGIKDQGMVSLQLEIITKTSWSCAVCWFFLLLIPFFRIIFVIDFNLYKVCVFKIDESNHNKKEEVLRITNYEEPKKIIVQHEINRVPYFDVLSRGEDLERSKKQRERVERQLTRRFIERPGKFSSSPSDGFFVTADIRMLGREKKSKKSTKSLNQTLQMKKSGKGSQMRRSVQIQSNLDDDDASKLRATLYQYDNFDTKSLYREDVQSTSSATRKTENFHRDWKTLTTINEICGDYETEHSIRLKKFM